MARPRRFSVDSLAGAQPGARLPFPAAQQRHLRVLRLADGAPLEVFDASGHSATGVLRMDGGAPSIELHTIAGVKLAPDAPPSGPILGVAWPKGKRAALLVEKCSELGAGQIVPLRFERSVVAKDEESEGVQRLRRIAAEAAKQCGRNTVPTISADRTLPDFARDWSAVPGALRMTLDPRAAHSVADLARDWNPAAQPLVFAIGPEGGMTPAELQLLRDAQFTPARLAPHILRIETAALAACAVAMARINTAP